MKLSNDEVKYAHLFVTKYNLSQIEEREALIERFLSFIYDKIRVRLISEMGSKNPEFLNLIKHFCHDDQESKP